MSMPLLETAPYLHADKPYASLLLRQALHCTDTLGAKHYTWAKHGAEAKADADAHLGRFGRDGSSAGLIMRVGWPSGDTGPTCIRPCLLSYPSMIALTPHPSALCSHPMYGDCKPSGMLWNFGSG